MNKKLIVDALKTLKANPEEMLTADMLDAGICWYLETSTPVSFTQIMWEIIPAFQSWKKFSGSDCLPICTIAYENEESNASELWQIATSEVTDNMLYTYTDKHPIWGKNTKYGRLRWELIDHIIEVLENAKTTEENT